MLRFSSLVLLIGFLAPHALYAQQDQQPKPAQPAATQTDQKSDEDSAVIDLTGGEPIQTERPKPKTETKKGAAAAPAQAQAETGPITVKWEPPANATPDDLRKARMVRGRGLTVIASINDYPEYNFTRIDLDITNQSEAPVNVDPARITFTEIQPKNKQLKQLDAKKLATEMEADEYKSNSADIIHGAGGVMNAGLKGDLSQTSRSTIVYNGQEYPFLEFVRGTSVRKGDLVVGQRGVGGVYFVREKNRTQTLLKVVIGDVTFEIPFEGDTAKK